MSKLENNFNYQKTLKTKGSFNMIKYLNVEKYINRPLASLIVKAVFNSGISPNQLTYFSFFIGLIGAILLAMGSYSNIIAGGILVQISSIFDCSDGMLARSKNEGTEFGKYLDLFLDRITDHIMILGIVIGLYRTSENIEILIIGLFTIAMYNLQINLFYINNLLEQKSTGETGELRALGIFMIMAFAFLNRLDIAIFILLAEVSINILFRIYYFLKVGRNKN